jgi:hypothetical protein
MTSMTKRWIGYEPMRSKEPTLGKHLRASLK